MCLIAAFSVSPYSSTFYRAGTKPFNPLLGETYECIREDKGWRFVAEQVCTSAFTWPIAGVYECTAYAVLVKAVRVRSWSVYTFH